MKRQPQNPEFRINPENFQTCMCAQPGVHMYKSVGVRFADFISFS